MRIVASNYNADCSWIPEASGGDYFIYDRSECGLDPSKVRKVENVGNADYDRLTYLVEEYDNLPDVFMLIKSNLFKYITKEEFDRVKDNTTFTPLLTQNHRTYSDQLGVVCYYAGGMYHERNDSWYLHEVPAKYFNDYASFAHEFQLPNPRYIPFAPGGNYILTREKVHKYSRDYYDKMRSILPYCQLPGEAQLIERSYYNIWR